MKTLIVIRHGDAEASQGSDDLRNLTSLGERQILQTTSWLMEQGWLGCAPDFQMQRLLVSPLARAQQSAQIFKKVSSAAVALETRIELTPESDIPTLLNFLRGISDESVVMVSHMPLVANLIWQCSNQSVKFSTGSVAVLGFDSKTPHLHAFYSPRLTSDALLNLA